jgi:prepilin-type N-terminal cleavage/methylation domain-containing protein
MKRSGFTLIELLVVIAIIAILAAILFPVFAQAKQAAKKSVEISHIKQFSLAHFMYSADHEDVFALARTHGGGVDAVHVLSIYPYVKNYQIFVSPAGKPNPVDNAAWNYIWSFGAIPRAATKKIPYYTVGNWPITQQLGVVGARMDGFLGWAQAVPGTGAWGGWWTRWQNDASITVPSLSQSALSSPAEAALNFSAGEPFGDFATFDAGTELGVCVAGRETYNPGSRSIGGATPRWGGPTNCNGWREAGGGGSGTIPANLAAKVKEGQAVISFADGSTKSMALTRLYRLVPCPTDASVQCMAHFMPQQ